MLTQTEQYDVGFICDEDPIFDEPALLIERLLETQADERAQLLFRLGELANRPSTSPGALQVRWAVLDGTSVYLEMLSDPCARVRTAAAWLLSQFPERAQANLWWLGASLDNGESDPLVRAILVAAIGRLAKPDSPALGRVQQIAKSREPLLVRLAASLCLGWVEKRSIPKAFAGLMSDRPAEFQQALETLSWCGQVARAVVEEGSAHKSCDDPPKALAA